uniref:Uncharacterized protein n=1 Tax=Rhizophora mucronata TaxID=61149 RepID=A0A2P2JEG7_RHIMU
MLPKKKEREREKEIDSWPTVSSYKGPLYEFRCT